MTKSIYQVSLVVLTSVLTSACSNGFQTSMPSSQQATTNGNSSTSTYTPMNTEAEKIAALKQIFSQVLGREADQAGLDYFMNQLSNGVDIGQIKNIIASSDESKRNITNLYLKNLNRPPTDSELNSDIAKLVHNYTLSQVEQIILAAQQDYLRIESIVRNAYISILQREADSGGLDYWIKRLNGGLSEWQMRMTIANSPEGSGLLDAIYKKHLGRSPTIGEITYDIGRLVSGITMAAVEAYVAGASNSDPVSKFLKSLYTSALNRTIDVGGFVHYARVIRDTNTVANCIAVRAEVLNSTEFRGRNLSNADFIETLYRSLFQRSSDVGGKQFWVNQLASGLSRTDVIAAMNGSDEGKLKCQISLGAQ